MRVKATSAYALRRNFRVVMLPATTGMRGLPSVRRAASRLLQTFWSRFRDASVELGAAQGG